MTEEERNTPTTVRELGIEFRGFKNLVDERFVNLSADINRLAKALEEANSQKADQKDLLDLRTDFKTFKASTQLTLDKRPWAAIFLSSALTLVLTTTILYVVNDILNGR